MQNKELAIVIPVFNEEVSVGKVLAEWSQALASSGINYFFLIVNDGSKDHTPKILDEFAKNNPERTLVLHQSNQGHGQACINGYRKALENQSEWIFQIDSDGQCDPVYFKQIWSMRKPEIAVIGKRVSRDDGQIRMYVSKVLSLAIFLGLGVWVQDSNVPYRLFHKTMLTRHIHKIPADFFLANALMTGLIARHERITWVPIHFRDRFGGSPSLQGMKLFKRGASIFLDFFGYRENGSGPAAK